MNRTPYNGSGSTATQPTANPILGPGSPDGSLAGHITPEETHRVRWPTDDGVNLPILLGLVPTHGAPVRCLADAAWDEEQKEQPTAPEKKRMGAPSRFAPHPRPVGQSHDRCMAEHPCHGSPRESSKSPVLDGLRGPQ